MMTNLKVEEFTKPLRIAEEILESAEAADLEVRKFTVYTNNNIPRKKK